MKFRVAVVFLGTAACFSVAVHGNDDYISPRPLREAATSDLPATDINDNASNLTEASKAESPDLVADSLKLSTGASPDFGSDDVQPKVVTADTGPVDKTSVEISQKTEDATEGSVVAALTTENATETSAAKDQIEKQNSQLEGTEKTPVFNSSKNIDPVFAMIGGHFNTEENQRLAESFLNIRKPLIFLRTHRDL